MADSRDAMRRVAMCAAKRGGGAHVRDRTPSNMGVAVIGGAAGGQQEGEPSAPNLLSPLSSGGGDGPGFDTRGGTGTHLHTHSHTDGGDGTAADCAGPAQTGATRGGGGAAGSRFGCDFLSSGGQAVSGGRAQRARGWPGKRREPRAANRCRMRSTVGRQSAQSTQTSLPTRHSQPQFARGGRSDKHVRRTGQPNNSRKYSTKCCGA